MNEKALRVLEYNKIIDMLAGKAGSPAGKELCRNLRPSADLSEIRQRQTETTDALARIYKNGGLSFAGIRDIRGSVMRLKIGGTLGIPELLHIASTLDVAAKVKSYGSENVSEEDTDDSLTEYFSLLEPLTPLRREIRRCLPDEETVADDASPALKDVRRQIRNTNERIHGQLTAMVSSASLAPKLQDNIITMRGGRYCIPVKAEYRSQVPGMIHDQSSTGSTLFIEPMAIVKLNNDLRELAGKEAEEIQHILENLSEEAAQAIQMIESDISLLTTLDFIFARASLSRSYNGSAPEFNTEGRIDIRRGRHPLLDPHKVVPIDLHFGDSHRMLIITGPNTGGKTVSLKTIGLFTLMGQAGLHIPAAEGSKLSVFHEVFADIGDEQSIEQNLSTFSSHMTNIVSILEGADEHTLILLDPARGSRHHRHISYQPIQVSLNKLDQDMIRLQRVHLGEIIAGGSQKERSSEAVSEIRIQGDSEGISPAQERSLLVIICRLDPHGVSAVRIAFCGVCKTIIEMRRFREGPRREKHLV